MARYIDADALWKRTTTKFDYCEEFLELIETQPTADVVERKTGEWVGIYYTDTVGNSYTAGMCCSECYFISEANYNFCPNCGADMRERENNGVDTSK